MGITDWIVIAIVAALIVGAAVFVIRQKKRGKACIGCPESGNCGGNCGSCGQ